MKRGMAVLFYRKGNGKGCSKVRRGVQPSVIKHPETNTTYHWTPVESLDDGITDIIYRCPICVVHMKDRGWSDEAISG
eukprot:6124051-Lingulodinium_polyedra.AAC.1